MSCGGGDVANQPCPRQRVSLTFLSMGIARIQMSSKGSTYILRAQLSMGKRRVKVSAGAVVGLLRRSDRISSGCPPPTEWAPECSE